MSDEPATTTLPFGPDKSFSKGLALLEVLARSPQPRGVSELGRALGITKSNAYRLLQTLSACGFVRRDVNAGTYEASLKLWELGVLVIDRVDIHRAATPYLSQLSQESGESVHLSILEGPQVLYIDKVESPQPVRAYSAVGGRAPAHCVATGKVLLAHVPTEARAALIANLQGHTPNTITDPTAMEEELARIRRDGWALNKGEWRETVWGIASPITDARNRVVAAVGISGPAERLKPRQIKAITPVVIRTAGLISRELGAPGDQKVLVG